jgi:hypothetical protein
VFFPYLGPSVVALAITVAATRARGLAVCGGDPASSSSVRRAEFPPFNGPSPADDWYVALPLFRLQDGEDRRELYVRGFFQRREDEAFPSSA